MNELGSCPRKSGTVRTTPHKILQSPHQSCAFLGLHNHSRMVRLSHPRRIPCATLGQTPKLAGQFGQFLRPCSTIQGRIQSAIVSPRRSLRKGKPRAPGILRGARWDFQLRTGRVRVISVTRVPFGGCQPSIRISTTPKAVKFGTVTTLQPVITR